MKNYRIILILLLIIPLGAILTTPVDQAVPGFFADEAVYYAMCTSLVYDFDLTWSRQDLETICKKYPAGPVGVILRENPDGTVVYAKPLLYPLVAALFFLLTGPSGILIFNYLCLWMILFWLSKQWGHSLTAVAIAAGVLIFSAFLPYTLWIHPEIFTAFLVAGFACNWLNRTRDDNRFAYLKMAVFIALATMVKPPLILLGIPVVYSVFRQKKFKELSVFFGVCLLLAAITYGLIGSMNPYEGNRKIFHNQFPHDTHIDPFDSGDSWSSEKAVFYFNANVISWNLFYYLFGRFSGLVWYFFPGLFLAILALLKKNNSDGKLLLFTCLIIVLIQIVMIPTNYHGGGGALGNRYFVSLYPLLLFSLPTQPKLKRMIPALILSAIFAGPFLVNPWTSSYKPGDFTKTGFYSYLPVEWTLTGAFPIFDSEFYRVTLPNIQGHFNFLDSQTSGLKNQGFDVYPGKSTQFVVALTRPETELTFFVSSNSGILNGKLSAHTDTTYFIADTISEKRVDLALGEGHHRTNIHGIEQWIYLVTCQISDDSRADQNDPRNKPAVHFRTFPSNSQETTRRKKQSKLLFKSDHGSYNSKGKIMPEGHLNE